jgi:Uma2 family endonuclease
MILAGEVYQHVKLHGGRVFPAPTDVFFSDTNVVEPDVLFNRPEHARQVERKFVRAAPDVVVEVSSASTSCRVLPKTTEPNPVDPFRGLKLLTVDTLP